MYFFAFQHVNINIYVSPETYYLEILIDLFSFNAN